MNHRAVIFDLDGTLVNSLPGIETSASVAIAKCLPGAPTPNLKSVIGPPIAKMFSLLWPELPNSKIEEVTAAFRSHYDAEGYAGVHLYEGVQETLHRVSRAGLRLFVLTNKPRISTLRILQHLKIDPLFEGVICPDSVQPPFSSKAGAAKYLVEQFGIGRALVVGDGSDDLEAATVCGFPFATAAYGYGRLALSPPENCATLPVFSDLLQVLGL